MTKHSDEMSEASICNFIARCYIVSESSMEIKANIFLYWSTNIETEHRCILEVLEIEQFVSDSV